MTKLTIHDMTVEIFAEDFNVDLDTGTIRRRNGPNKGKITCTTMRGGYYSGDCRGVKVYAHKIVLAAKTGELWTGHEFHVDHKNRDKLDNRGDNLHKVDASGNLRNTVKSKNNTSGFKGVHFDKTKFKNGSKKCWTVDINDNNYKKHRKSFQTKIEAIAYRLMKEREYNYAPA